MADKDQDILSMSDEEFAKMNPPSVSTDEDKSATTSEPPAQDNTPADPPKDEEPKPEPEKNEEPEPKPEDPPKDEEPAPEPEKKDEEPPAEEPEPKKPEAKADPESETKPEPKKPEPESKLGAEYEAFYKAVMAPFKANGKTIQLQSADEVIQLMQMGANYTKKMQAIQSSKKYLMMLEQNGLLDEAKLSFLIDLDKKNPEAIKKLMKDAKIDPVDVDPAEGVNYKGGAHAVSDQEAAFASAIDDLSSTPEGKITLQSVNVWDATSKKALFDNPQLLSIIHSQHENGIYAKIVAEMERRKLLGQVAADMPFLHAYKTIGDDMNAKGAFGVAKPAAAPSKPAAGTPVAVRPAKTPAAKAAEAARVRAAAPPRSSAAPARMDINVLAMSDEDFLKMQNKV